MSRSHLIQTKIGKKIHEEYHCPFLDVDSKGSRCRLTDFDCRYGLTDNRIPTYCPMKTRVIRITYRTR